jgi:MFS transporter, FSR family, fosmidomycin resistance protein
MRDSEVHSRITHFRPHPPSEPGGTRPVHTYYSVLAGVSSAHMLNDMMQSLIVTIYPLLQGEFHNFIEIGAITLTFQLTASLLQPLVGALTDKYPLPYATPVGMGFSLGGVLLMSVAPAYPILLLSVALIGSGLLYFIRNRHRSHAPRLEDVTGWHSHYSRSGVT